jgi:2-haloacid dehalogenase
MTSRTQAIVFDAYGTLFDVRSVIAQCDREFPGHGAELSKLWRTKQLEYTWLLSLMGHYKDFWTVTGSALRFACRALGLECSAAAHNALLETYLHLDTFPEVNATLNTLAQDRLAILSNGSPRMLAALVENAGLENVFAAVISVDEVQVYKPHPSTYWLASHHLSVPENTILFVSSNFWDIAGASSFGFRTCWVNRGKFPQEELGLTPDFTVGALDGLPVLID